MPASDFNQRLKNAADRLRKSQADYLDAIVDANTKDRVYHVVDAKALTSVEEYRNNDDRKAQAETLPVEVTVAPGAPRQRTTLSAARYEAKLAGDLKSAHLEAVRNYRQELSALQSLMSLEKSEADFTRWAPHEAVGT